MTDISEVENLVFKGGSVKGVAYAGSLYALDSHLPLSKIKRVAGTSAGALTALVVALNYSPTEVIDILGKTAFEDFLDADRNLSRRRFQNLSNQSSSSQASTLSSVYLELTWTKELGLYPGHALRDWVEELIFSKTKIRNTTFKELYNIPNKNFKELFVVGYNLSAKRSQIFSLETTPDSVISDAIRISASIPVLFNPHFNFIKPLTSRDGEVVRQDNSLWIDGGISQNYPINVFDDFPLKSTLGFYLTSASERLQLEGSIEEHNFEEIQSLPQFQNALFQACTCFGPQWDAHLSKEKLNNRTVYIDSCDVDTLQMNISVEDKNRLLESEFQANLSAGVPHGLLRARATEPRFTEILLYITNTYTTPSHHVTRCMPRHTVKAVGRAFGTCLLYIVYLRARQ